MSAAPAAVATDGDEGRLFGLDAEEAALLRALFIEAVAPQGIDGGRVFDALQRGRTLREALNLPPKIEQVLYARAHAWFAAGRHDRAEDLFRVLCFLDGQDADNWVGYGVCLRVRENRDEAELAFATAAALRPAWAVPHFHAAGLAIARERWDMAAEHLLMFRNRVEAGTPETMQREAARIADALAQRAARARDPGSR